MLFTPFVKKVGVGMPVINKENCNKVIKNNKPKILFIKRQKILYMYAGARIAQPMTCTIVFFFFLTDK